ncbi:MAG: hypothetical protein PHW40_00750 [Candidatus Izemoplasmatales bacterium]|nr:hypothetical protein [Candidatus Izemoplasmatales bacterium]
MLSMVFSLILGIFIWGLIQSAPLSGAALIDADSLFVNASGIEVIADSEAPESFASAVSGTIARDFDLGMRGVLLKSNTAGSSVDLSSQFSGSFEMTFRAFSATSHHDQTGDDWRSTTLPMTPYTDLREVAFDFTDVDGETFTVLITAGERWNTITPAARVRIFGSDIGYHYLGDATIPSDTAVKNSSGYYTRIGGATFANVARRATLTSANSVPVTFGYNAETMEVYVLHYGTSAVKSAEYRVVLDLDDPSMGLRRLESFKDYTVSIRMNQIASGREANMIIYDINGQSLDGSEFTNSIGPELTYQVSTKGVVGESLTLNAPKAFDLLEGNIPYEGTVRVLDPEQIGVDLYTSDGTPITDDVFVPGAYFVPDVAGTYTLIFQGVDSHGLPGDEKRYPLTIVSNFLSSTYEIEGDYSGLIENPFLGLGSTFTVYPARVLSAMHLGLTTFPAEVTLKKDGVVVQDLNQTPLTSPVSLTLTQTGDYELTYATPDFGDQGNVRSITFTVDETTPVFNPLGSLHYMQSHGTTIVLPRAEVTLGTVTKQATLMLYGPNGQRVTLDSSRSVFLDQVGSYRLVYMVNFDRTYTMSRYFTVGYHTDDVFQTTNRTAVIQANQDSGSLFPAQIGGIKLTAGQENDTFTYQKVIDLSQNTKHDSLIEMMVLPSAIGKLDFWQFTIKLTDIHNPKNVVNIIVFKGSWGNEWSYVRSGANNQMPSGWENGIVLTAYNAGTPVGFSFTGESNLSQEMLNLFFDNEERALYVANIKRPGYAYGNQVIDYDSTDCFQEKMLWDGFTTGEVELSISVQSLQTGTASLLVHSVNGVELSGSWLVDDEAPNIFVNTAPYTTQNLPIGKVSTPYPVFPARAYDKIDGTVAYTTRVFRDYQTANQTEYTLEGNAFVPDVSGNYTIVYRSEDGAGNVSRTFIPVLVSDSLSPLDYVFDTPVATDVFVGTVFTLPSGSASGGSGFKEVVSTITSPTGATIPLIDHRFSVAEAGVYTLTIDLEDYLGTQRTITYSIQSTYSSSPIIEDFAVPPVFIQGISYTLPDFEAFDYYTNPGEAQAATKKIEVTEGGVTRELGPDRIYIPNVSENGAEITLRFSAQALGSEATSEKVFTAHVVIVEVDESAIDLSRFFYQEAISSVSKQASHIDYFLESSDARLLFANPLIANQLRFEFTVPLEHNQFSAVVVTLQDSENPDIAVDLTITKHASANSATSYLSINNEPRMAVSGSFYEVTSYGFNIRYNGTSQYLVDLNGNQLLGKITKTKFNQPFNGFPSGKVYLSYAFQEVTGSSAIRIVSVGNQVFSDDTLDRIRPQIELTAFLPKVGEIHEPFRTPGAFAADVLDPHVTLTLTIRRGSDVIYQGNIDTDYLFHPTEYGMYRFVYSAVDRSNRRLEITYLVTIKDRIPPEIELDGAVPTQGTLNQPITLPSATVTDNHDTDVRLWIFISGPNGEIRALDEDVFTFTPVHAGEYTITYYAQDTYNSYQYHRFKITVG